MKGIRLHNLELALSVMAAVMAGSLGLACAVADSRSARVDAVFGEYDKPDSPGCALGVIQDGEFVYRKGYGMASLELGVPNSPQMVYYIGSTSKQFVAASIVIAARLGHLSLDDDIRKFLPEIPEYGGPVTIRHLIHHTSGLRDYLSIIWMAGLRYEDVHTDEEIIAMIARQKELNFKPGEEYLYSNSGYFLLAQIIKRATGTSLRQFAEEKIFEPLGMKHTHFHDDRFMVVRNRAMAYGPGEDGGFQLDWYPNFDKVGSGGLLTTAEDLLLWDRNFYSDALAGGGLVEQMLERGVLNDGEKLDYAFGLNHDEYRGLATVSHSGGFMGFRAQLLRFPTQRFSVVVLCNFGDLNPVGLAQEVADIYFEEHLGKDDAEKTAESDATVAGFIELPAKDLEKREGSYRNPETGVVISVSHNEGKLDVTGGPRPMTLAPLSETRFRTTAGPVVVDVEFGEEDGLVHMYYQGEEFATLEPIAPYKPDEEDLGAFVGKYSSEELDSVWEIAVQEGKLTFRRGPYPLEMLEPAIPDEFQMGRLRLEFTRDEMGGVTGLVINSEPVRSIRFERLGLP